ncbi:hypothetical protein ADIAL_0712 [Alkalibacterium sp. AK22]|uniref:hypothetical protein n=1 Tax=Alkalibacterium sp. AK22 TaxID=1229520 RepID=UPI00044836FE|nr:hypothetical protein [Alkalibacterium sp. AK22]EXJ23920.1 hypothetical protein ADIAL_0712 [Alkalibacterium sp. AK22]
MKKGFKHIIWGFVLVHVTITLGGLTILPAFVGWLIVRQGFSEMDYTFPESSQTVIKKVLDVLIVLSLAESLWNLLASQPLDTYLPLMYYPVLYLILELVVFHKLLEAVARLLAQRNRPEKYEVYRKKDKAYLILMGSATVFMTAALTVFSPAFVSVSLLIALSGRIYLLFVLAALKNTDLEMDLNPVEPAKYQGSNQT